MKGNVLRSSSQDLIHVLNFLLLNIIEINVAKVLLVNLLFISMVKLSVLVAVVFFSENNSKSYSKDFRLKLFVEIA